MLLKKLKLTNFRNYKEFSEEFSKLKTIIIGQNAQGKSNILEAISILATSKSSRASKDAELISFNEEYGLIFAAIEKKGDTLDIGIQINPSGRRKLKINGVAKKSPQADLLGNFFAVMFSCEDLFLIKGSPSARRDWLDYLLLQVDQYYNQNLKTYEKAVAQKNALLKQSHETGMSKSALLSQLEVWNEQIIDSGTEILLSRILLVNGISPYAKSFQSEISREKENLNLAYESTIFKDFSGNLPTEKSVIKGYFKSKMEQSFPAEHARGQCLIGPHRDDVLFSINDRDAKAFCSQGQQRSIVLSLKLAELKIIENWKSEIPVLLLDDVFAELDDSRQDYLLHNLPQNIQTFITTTHITDLQNELLENAQVLKIENGNVLEAQLK